VKIIHHQIHGQDYHDMCIYLAERILYEKGWEMTDKRWFKERKLNTGDPDIFATLYSHFNGAGGKRVDVIERIVVEIESDLTRANKEKKERQFDADIGKTITGVRLIIINLADIKNQDSIKETIAHLEKWL
jgi:hypothetical protein